VGDHVFPGAAFSVVHHGEITTGALGHFTYENDSAWVTADTIYDLASLTKILATTAMAMLLYERGTLRLETPLADLVPEFVEADPDPRRRAVTVRMLLAHSSGLPAYKRLFLRAHNQSEMFHAACAVALTADPGTRAEYSDIGFMLLAMALERLAGESLDAFCSREIYAPVGMHQTMFRPREEFLPRIPPSEDDGQFRHKVIRGEVNDENAWVIGGIGGHAGLFSSATDIAKFADCMLRGGSPVFRADTIELFTRREPSPPGTSRALGWDTPSQPSSSGKYFSTRAFGHLGFTGTSLWIDPECQLAITLLTNRTWPDRGSQDGIRRVRPEFHDAVVEALK
jgi:CubicO group peptidase (beta-lactamase class C family)